METVTYKNNIDSVIERLTNFYERKACDQVFVDFQLPSNTLMEFCRANRSSHVPYPDPAERARFWDSLLKEKVHVEDDSIPSAYLSEFDQGLYGALIGGEIEFICDPDTGWISSMVKPMLEELTEFGFPELDENNPWFQKYTHQLQIFSEASKNKFGISHFILIDSLNFIFELVGGTKTYLSLFECPEVVRRVIDYAFELNVKIQETFFENTPSYKGGTFSNIAQWVPGRIVSESIDPFHMTSVDEYEQWGEENVEKMFDYFDGGVLHIHSNGRHLLKAVSQLNGLKALYLLDEKGNPPAFEILPSIKKQTGDVPLVVNVDDDAFSTHLNRGSLEGGVLYIVNTNKAVNQVNRLMETIRKLRV